MQNIPIIDISDLENRGSDSRSNLIEQLCAAFHEIGFVAICGHGIPQALLSEVRQQVIDLFDRPLEEKLSLQVQQDNYRGYVPNGFFTPNGANVLTHSPDYYEAYKLHYEVARSDPICESCSLYGPNRWPKNSSLLQYSVIEYWRKCDRLTSSLLSAVAEFLGLDDDYFARAFEQPLSNMTLLHYPKSNSNADSSGIHSHKDTDVLTILAPDPVGGLFVRRRESDLWIEVMVPSDTLLVNVGDMLEIWTAGYFVSTPHKVDTPKAADRYSFPYFAVPRYDVLVKPLEFDRTLLPEKIDEESFKQRSMHCGDVSRKIWQSNWPDSQAIDFDNDPFIS